MYDPPLDSVIIQPPAGRNIYLRVISQCVFCEIRKWFNKCKIQYIK